MAHGHECGESGADRHFLETAVAPRREERLRQVVDPARVDEVCAVTKPLGLSTVIKNYDLDDDVTFCP